MVEKYQLLEVNTWARKAHCEFYQQFAQPYFSIGCELNAERLFTFCRNQGLPFSHGYLFLIIKALNQLTPFCYRLVDGQVRVYQDITLSMTVMAADQTFRFCHVPYAADLSSFQQNLLAAHGQAMAAPFMPDNFAVTQANKATVYLSVIPWIRFSSFSHAYQGSDSFGIPRLAIGKMDSRSFALPFSIDVHHSLVDGWDVGQLIEQLQDCFDQPPLWLADR